MFHSSLQAAKIPPGGQRCHHQGANPVESARHLLGVAVGRVLELTARVELCHDDFGRRHAFPGVDAGGNAAPVVLDRHRTVGVEDDEDAVAMAGQRLVDGVVRSEEHTSDLQSLMRISYAVFCLKKKKSYDQNPKRDK